MTQPETPDPFAAGTKTPSLSFEGCPVGTVKTGIVTSLPELVQTLNFDTNEPEFWPAKGNETPQPKMAVVIGLNVDGEALSVWARKYPPSLFDAIAQAQREAGARIAIGGTLSIRLSGEEPNKDPKKHATKLYQARYAPPDAFAQPAPVAPAAPVQAAQPVAPAPVAQAAPWDAPAPAAAPWDTAPPF